jgi:dual specificity protein phosphatase-like protein
MKGILDGPDGKPILFVGDDNDDQEAAKKGYTILSACKDGPYGHRAALRYTTMGAPKDENYFHATRGKRMVLNLLDVDDPKFIPEEVIFPALRFINKHLKAGDKVLAHCNAGHSRSPSLALAYLRAIGEMPYNFRTAEKVFKSLYPRYAPGLGMRTFVRQHWEQLEKFFQQSN